MSAPKFTTCSTWCCLAKIVGLVFRCRFLHAIAWIPIRSHRIGSPLSPIQVGHATSAWGRIRHLYLQSSLPMTQFCLKVFHIMCSYTLAFYSLGLATWADEDHIGRISRVARHVHSLQLARSCIRKSLLHYKREWDKARKAATEGWGTRLKCAKSQQCLRTLWWSWGKWLVMEVFGCDRFKN